MILRLLAFGVALSASSMSAQRHLSIPVADAPSGKGAQIQADLYGGGNRAVVLAHGGRFNKDSWRKQAPILARAGFLVLAINYRGDTFNADGSPSALGSDDNNAIDVQAAAAYLKAIGAKSVAAIGASLGGDAVGDAEARSPAGILTGDLSWIGGWRRTGKAERAQAFHCCARRLKWIRPASPWDFKALRASSRAEAVDRTRRFGTRTVLVRNCGRPAVDSRNSEISQVKLKCQPPASDPAVAREDLMAFTAWAWAASPQSRHLRRLLLLDGDRACRLVRRKSSSHRPLRRR